MMSFTSKISLLDQQFQYKRLPLRHGLTEIIHDRLSVHIDCMLRFQKFKRKTFFRFIRVRILLFHILFHTAQEIKIVLYNPISDGKRAMLICVACGNGQFRLYYNSNYSKSLSELPWMHIWQKSSQRGSGRLSTACCQAERGAADRF